MQCKSCGHVKRERLEFLADNPFYTKRFAYYVGRRCRQATILRKIQTIHSTVGFSTSGLVAAKFVGAFASRYCRT